MKLTVQAPGKLMISGEWSVLENGNSSIVAAFDRYVYCDYEDSEEMLLNCPDIKLTNIHGIFQDGTFTFKEVLNEEDKAKAEISRRAIETVLRYLTEDGKDIKGFSISTDSIEHTITIADGTQQKTGLGTSAAITAALIGTLLKVHGYDLAKPDTTMLIFKLAAISHYLAQGSSGSGFDIAACAFGGVQRYQRFDAAWLSGQIAEKKPLKDVAAADWPGLSIEKVTLPPDMQLFAGWAGKPASTVDLIQKIQKFKDRDPGSYGDMMSMLKQTTETLLEAIKTANQAHILNCIEANRLCLKQLGDLSSVSIETPELAKLADIAKQHQGAGKLSGAGGGDCGIAACFDQFVKEDIEWAWEEAGLYPLDVFVSERGVSVWY